MNKLDLKLQYSVVCCSQNHLKHFENLMGNICSLCSTLDF